jgi:uncharacterized protein GlcG (DUF336 family)
MKKAIWAGLSSILISTSAMAANATCPTLAMSLSSALKQAVAAEIAADTGAKIGFGLNMWATVVAADGRVCEVAYSGASAIQGQWLASRVISAQKAFSAATLSLSDGNGGFAISTANLYTATQPGGSLFGLQHSNPVAPANAYGDKINSAGANVGPTDTGLYGTPKDPMVGQVIGGINVFGGGLALYTSKANKVGGVGVSGDTSCTDHMVAWRVRRLIGLDKLNGIAGPTGDPSYPDNIIFDITYNPANTVGPYASPSLWGHPTCKGATNAEATTVRNKLPSVQ